MDKCIYFAKISNTVIQIKHNNKNLMEMNFTVSSFGSSSSTVHLSLNFSTRFKNLFKYRYSKTFHCAYMNNKSIFSKQQSFFDFWRWIDMKLDKIQTFFGGMCISAGYFFKTSRYMKIF